MSNERPPEARVLRTAGATGSLASPGIQTRLELESPVMTVDELADLLRVDRKSVYAAIQRNEIPGVQRIGKTLRIHRATVVAWLADGQVSPRSRRHP
ncbi:MAG: helix-turn-helix domain-containing protein [Deltaproteobacteria bacterium]